MEVPPSAGTAPPAPMMAGRTKTHRKAVLNMLEKIMILHEMKLMGIDITAKLEKMYLK